MKRQVFNGLGLLVVLALLLSLGPGTGRAAQLFPLAAADAENVELVGHYDGAVYTVAVQGDYAYIDEGVSLAVLDISDPAAPTWQGKTLPLPDGVQDIAVAGSYAYVAGWTSGLRVVDVSDPIHPDPVSSYETAGFGREVAVSGGYAYLACGSSGLQVVDVSEPITPTAAGSYDSPGESLDVAVAGNYAYVADGGSGLRVLNVSDPAHPAEVGYYDTPGSAEGVVVVGDLVYVADGSSGLQVVDVSDPAHPAEVGYYDTPGNAVAVAAAGEYAYVADGDGGLLILRYALGGPAYLPLVVRNYPPTYSISGRITDGAGAPAPGVLLSTDTGYTTITNGNGDYTLEWLLEGDYILTPSKDNYTFSPSARLVSVPPDAMGQNFMALAIASPTPTTTQTPTITPTPTATPTPSPTLTIPPCTEAVASGGFEYDGDWDIPITDYPAGYTTAAAHSGNRSMRVGIVEPTHNLHSYSSVQQQVTIPAGATSATFSFWLYPMSSGVMSTAVWDSPPYPVIGETPLADDAQYVLVYDQNNQQHTLLFQRRDDRTWMFHQFDLMAFAGQTIKLYFGVYNNGWGGVTGMYVDDVSLEICSN